MFGTLPTLALLGSESYPSITTVQGRDSAMVCWGPYMCRDVWPPVSTNSSTLLGFYVFLDHIVVLAISRLEFSLRGAGAMHNCS